MLRSNLRLISALVLLAFVVCHLTAHGFLLVSFARAEAALDMLMYPWRTAIGTAILVSALLAHYLNALWSIYVRRYLRLSRWEWWQLGLGLCIPLLLMLHVTSTRIAESLLGVTSHYSSVLIVQWLLSPWLAVLQATAVLTVWIHACIGVHFWLRTKPWYAHWRPLFVGLGMLLPTLALSGYVAAGNQVLRDAENPNYAKLSLEASNLTDQKRAEIGRIARYRLGRLPSPGIAALCRPRRARLALSPSPAAAADPFERTNRTPIAGRDGARNVARKRHSPRFGLRRKGALHHLPDSGDTRAGQAARAIGIGGQSAGPHRSDARHAARLPDLPDRRHLCHAASGRRRQRCRRYGPWRPRGKRALDHGGVRRSARLHHLGRGQAALRPAVHSQSVLQ